MNMNKRFFLALMLASGLAFAQSSGSSPGSSDQQQPSTQQAPTSSGQSSQPSSAAQSSLTGCLKGSDSGWVIVAEGQSTPVTGDSSTLGPHNGHQVQVKGTQASDGSFQVTDIVMIADTCPKQQDSSASSGAGAAAGAAGAATAAATDASPTATSAASDTANAAQNAPAAQSPTTPQSTTPPSTTPPAPGGQSASAGQGAQKLPQSASPLPLWGLLGLASLASGLFVRRRK